MKLDKNKDTKLSSSNPWNLNGMWVVVIHPVLEIGNYQVNSLLAQINLLFENGIFFGNQVDDVFCWCVLEIWCCNIKNRKEGIQLCPKRKENSVCQWLND